LRSVAILRASAATGRPSRLPLPGHSVGRCLPKMHENIEDDVTNLDMGPECLSGELGDWCYEHLAAFPLSYAWPTLLTVASSLIDVRVQGLAEDADGCISPGRECIELYSPPSRAFVG